MESLIQAFGIDLRLIVIQIINFAVLAAALSYFLYKPVLKLLKDREDKITQGMSDAEQAAKAREMAEEDRKVVLKEAHKEAEEVSKRAESHAKDKAAEIASVAEKEAAHKLKLAEDRSAALLEEAHRKSEAEIAKLAVLATEKLLNERSA